MFKLFKLRYLLVNHPQTARAEKPIHSATVNRICNRFDCMYEVRLRFGSEIFLIHCCERVQPKPGALLEGNSIGVKRLNSKTSRL